ncbi:hypothetical protein Era103g16 [Erwinia phage Era103]|nr:hypothetical protein Era103g16 [Erwinia phage Era103]ABM63406.1 unknown [Erwinia phage Era103]
MERWLPVSGYPNYEVSSKGRFRNVKSGNLLSPITVTKGYKAVRL